VRTPVFELHIRPLFRATDREHMMLVSGFDLWDYDAVVENADDILAHLEADMPPVTTGGLWPEEAIELFRRWTTTGRKRLELGAAQYTRTAAAGSVTLTATGTFPAAGYRGWLQIESETDASKTYVLYFEPPDAPVAGSGTAFTLRDRYAADNRSLFVHDSTGVHAVQ
jgi:hypothetical protein